MCGRYRRKNPAQLSRHLRDTFDLPDLSDAEPARYNIAPGQDCPVIILDDEGDIVAPASMRWGIVPSWDEGGTRPPPINLQAEKLPSSRAFGEALQLRRCLVPADGFYEWKRYPDSTLKVPYDIHFQGDRPFLMAGVYERATTTRPATFAVLTTAPNAIMRPIHDRMPAILAPSAARRWLTRGPLSPAAVATLTAPAPAAEMEAVSISSLINSPRHDTPEVLTPVAPPPPPPTQGELF